MNGKYCLRDGPLFFLTWRGGEGVGGGRVGKFAHANIFYIYMRLHVANIFCVTPSSCKHFKFLLACNLFQKFPPRMVRPELHGHEARIVRPFNPDIRATDNQSVWIIFYPPCCDWASYPEVCSKLTVKTDCKSNKRHDELTSSVSASRFHSRTTGWNLFRNKDEWRSFHQSKVLVFYH